MVHHIGIGRYYEDKIIWDNSPTNELKGIELDKNTPCATQFKHNKFGRYVPVCCSFKPKQEEFVWKDLKWEKKKINNKDSKIKVFIGFQNEEIKENITKIINDSLLAEIVGIGENEEDIVNQIINLKPEMVFMQYKFNTTNAFDMIKKANGELKLDVPIFNIIDDDVPSDKRDEIINLIGIKMNSIMEKSDPYDILVKDILKEYKDYDI